MKKKKNLLVALMALMLCAGLLAGCSGDEDETTAAATEAETETEEETDTEEETAQADWIGEVTEITDTALTVQLYESDTVIADYTDLDAVTLTDTGTTREIDLEEEASYQYVSAGVLYTTTQATLTEGDFVAVTTDEDGQQEIIILDYEPESSSSGSSTSGSSTSTEDDDATSGTEEGEDV